MTHRPHFREPFDDQLFKGVRFAPFPPEQDPAAAALDAVDEILEAADRSGVAIGTIIVEPIQGRGGIVVPPPGFLAGLRDRADGRTRVLVFDEVYTGCGRTGRWLACEHWDVWPDIVVVGKGLSGSLPISACIGRRDVMEAWPPSSGEAIHTSTFLGNPTACAAALAQLDQIERLGLLARAEQLGAAIRQWADSAGFVARGRGLIMGVETRSPEVALQVMKESLEAGVVLLAEGPRSDILAITPPAVITERQLDFALGIVGGILSRLSR